MGGVKPTLKSVRVFTAKRVIHKRKHFQTHIFRKFTAHRKKPKKGKVNEIRQLERYKII